MQTKNPGFRSDINGLRAIAVIAVVFYHFGVKGFSGGFAGVDIFFVISGFLMTGIIFRQTAVGKFSLIGFYLSRARRIIPALAVLCIALLAGGWFLLIPSDYKELGKHAASSIGFLSNMVYWIGSGYFDTSSHEKWLLHTWSLSVEWQFYMVYPLIIIAARKLLGFNATRILLVALAAGSFVLCLYASTHYPNTAFYTLPARAWEMIVGGLVYLFPVQMKNSHKQSASAIGLIAIAASISYFTAADVWPGWLALVPVLGTALIICAAHQSSIITNNKISSWFGEASYSIYLWHWPIVVLISYYGLDSDITVIAAGIAASIFLGFASLYLVEKPSQKLKTPSSKIIQLACYAALVFVVGLSSSLVFIKRGLEFRMPSKVAMADREGSNKNPESKRCSVMSGTVSPKCIFGDTNKPVGAIVIGDSHSDAIVSAVVEAARPERSILYLGYMSCLTIPGMHLQGESSSFQCGEFVKKQIEELESSYPGVPLVVINRTSVYVAGHNEHKDPYPGPPMYFDKPGEFNQAYKDDFRARFVSSMCELARNRPVYVMKPVPEMGINVPKTISRSLMRSGYAKDISISVQDYHQRHQFVVSVMEDAVKACGIKLLDPEPALCDREACYGSKDLKPLYYDDNHLSESGNKLLVPMFKTIWH
ncbi:acyltransferase family protein [Pseudomonas lurida]|uniref:acyltransferase family protein n=1 Tax=Pseudomonas lurida TaxID=244566 RepID=UPI00054C624D|nr:acyltransferase family protein [Pseudomonas lurida]